MKIIVELSNRTISRYPFLFLATALELVEEVTLVEDLVAEYRVDGDDLDDVAVDTFVDVIDVIDIDELVPVELYSVDPE